MDFSKIELMNIPLLDLKTKFTRNFQLFTSKHFSESVLNRKHKQPIKTPYFVWNGLLDDFYTYIVQDSVLGVESYIKGAVHIELGRRGLIKDNYKYIANPFLLKGEKGTAAKYYKLLPSLIKKEYSLDNNTQLWQDTKDFYQKVRNPLFHGNTFKDLNYQSFSEILNFISDIYEWIDSWHNTDEFLKSAVFS